MDMLKDCLFIFSLIEAGGVIGLWEIYLNKLPKWPIMLVVDVV
jgi:hypothetical protein